MAVILYSSNNQIPANFIASYATIQEAVNAAVDGNSLFIQSGTYTENVLIDKAITVLGANAGISGTGTRTLGEATINGSVTVSDNVTIDGVQILNSSDNSTQFIGLRVQGDVDVTVTNSRFFSNGPNGNVDDRAILLDTSATGNITITNNYIGGAAMAKYGTGSWHRGIWSDGAAEQLTITGNTFEYNRTAMNLDGYDDDAVNVSGNTIRSSGSGVSIGTPVGNEITNISGNILTDVDTDFNLQNVTTGISFDLDMTNNTGGGSGAAAAIVVLGSQAGDTLTGGDGVDALTGNGGADTLNGGAGDDFLTGGGGSDTVILSGTIASYSFTNLAISGGQITGGTIVGPDGTDTIVGVEALNIGGTFYVLPGMSIQAAIDAAPDGATIVVAAGTYVEQLTVEGRSGLTIMADTGAEVIVKAPASIAVNGTSVHYGDAVRAVIAVTDSDSISITGIEVDGSFAGDSTAGSNGDELTGIAYLASSGSIDDVEIYNVSNSPAGGLFGLQHGSGLFIDGKGAASTPAVSVTDSTISNFQKTGALVIGVELTFTGNTITGIGGTGLTAQNGLQVAQSSGTISGNTIADFGYEVPNGGTYFYSSGIIAYEPSDALAITDNTITGAATGEAAGLDLSDTGGNLVTVDGNTFSTLEYGIYAYTFTGGTLGLDAATIANNTFVNISVEGLHFAPEETYGDPFTTLNGFTVSGTQFDDVLAGSAGADVLSGLDGDDTLEGNGGNDSLDGGAGNDTAIFDANLGDATVGTIIDPVTGRVVAFTSVTTAGDGTESVTNVEALQFADATIDLADPVQLFDANGDFVATFDTIQAAIDAADPDATIRVAAGTYDEDVAVNKAVTILGPNEGVTGTASRGAEAIIDGAVTVTAAATIDGLQFLNSSDNATRFDSVTVSTSGDVTIQNSVFFSANPNGNFVGIGDTAIFLVAAATGKMTVTDNYITGASQAAFSTASWARGIWSDGKASELVISNNTIEYARSAMNLDSYDDTKSVVSGNLIEFSGSGISMGIPVSTVITAITNNTFTDVGDEFNFQNVTAPLSFDAAATGNVAVTGVTTAQFSILAGSSSDVITGTAGVDRIIGNNGNDVLNGGLGDDTIAAGGGNDVLVLSGTPADYDFSGLIISGGQITGGTISGPDGNDTVSGIEALLIDGTYYVLSGMSIQAAVNAAPNGATIVVAAGTYLEQVSINGRSGITIVAETGAEVTIEAPADVIETARSSSDREIHAVVTAVGSTDIVLENINVDGAGVADTISEGGGAGQANYVGVFFRNTSGTLQDVDIFGVRDPYASGTTVSGNQRGVGVQVDNDSLLDFTMNGGSITDFQKNATVFSRANLDVSGVTITGGGAQTINAQNGIQVLNSTGSISGNTISEIGYAGTQVVYSGLILAYGNTDLDITDNIIIGTNDDTLDAKAVGIFVLDFGPDNSGGSITGNTISFVDTAIDVSGTIQPDGILIENNTVTDLDDTDPFAAGLSFLPDTGTLTAFNISGTAEDDFITGGNSGDTLSGEGGDDTIDGQGGNDALDGGLGTDTAVFSSNLADATVGTTIDATGRATAFTTVSAPSDGMDTVTGFEVLQFADASLDLADPVQLFDSSDMLVGTFDTIQAAVDAASDGATIYVAAGTYNETLVIDTEVTIVGSNAGVAGTGARGAEAIITGTVTVNAAATLDGFRFVNGSTNAVRFDSVTVATPGDVTITNSVFFSTGENGNTGPLGIGDTAIFVVSASTGSISITDNYITGAAPNAFSTASWSRGIWSDGNASPLVITGNTLEFTRTGINLESYDDAVSTVSNNSFITAGSGISMGAPSETAITGITENTFENVGTDFNLRGVTTAISFDLDATNNVGAGTGAAATMTVLGGTAGDTITGTDGADVITGGGGNDAIDGGDGTDTVILGGNWRDYTIDGTGQVITDDRAVPTDGSDSTSNVEFFQFANVLASAAEIENDAPLGVDDALNAGDTINVLTNDTDADVTLGDTKTVTGARSGAESPTASLTSVSGATVIQGTYGSLTINADGTTSYAFDSALAASIALAGGETETDSFTYEVTDFKGLSDVAQIDVTVTGINEEPVGVNDTNATTENTDATGNVLANDIDDDNDTLVVTSVNQDVGAVGTAIEGEYGTLTLNFDGTYTYVTNDRLAEGDTGTDTFTYTLSDTLGGSTAYKITFDAYDPGPLANGENGWMITNPAFDQDVVTDSDGQALQFTRQVTSGGFGDQLFSPALIQTAGEEGVTNSFEASFSVNPNALQPGATGSYIGVSMDNGTGARGNLLRMETDAAGNWHLYAFDFDGATQTFPQIDLGILPVGADTKIGFTQVFNPGSGNDVWTVYVNDELVYTGEGWEDFFSSPGEPTPSPVTYDRLLFRASGSAAVGDLGVLIDDVSVTTNQQATLTIEVTGTNDTATITGTVIGDVTEDTDLTATGTLAVADADDDEDVFVPAAGSTTYGSYAITAAGEWTFNLDNANSAVQALAAGETLSDSFDVTSFDGTDTETVTITITGTNDTPTIEAGTDASGAVTEDADPVTLSDSGSIVFDDIDLTDTHTVSATPDSGNTLGGTLVANVSDDATGAGTGTVTWTYELANADAQTLAQGQQVTESFTVTIEDEEGATVDQIVTITVTGTDDLAIISDGNDAAGSATETGTLNDIAGADQTANNRLEPTGNYDTLVANLLAANPDDMPTVLAGVQAALPAGSGVAEAIAVVWDYLDDGFVFPASYYDSPTVEAFARLGVEYALYVLDGGAPLSGITAKFTPDNGDVDTLPQRSQSLHDNLLGNLFDFGLKDKLLGAGQGSNPNPDQATYDQIVQLLADNGLSALLTRPTYSGNQGEANPALLFDQANGLAPLTGGQLEASDIDAGSVITWTGSAEGTYGSFVIDSDGTWSYTLNNLDPDTQGLAAGEVVTEVFTTTVSDGQGATLTQDVTITITGTNDAPTGAATVTLANGTEDISYTVSAADLLTGFSDVDGDTLSVSNLAASGGGQVVDNGDSTYTITMPVNFNGAVTLTYSVIDGNGGFVSGSQSYTVAAANDAPVISGGPGTATYAEPTDNLGGSKDVPALTGTLTVSDVDTGDSVTGAVQGDAVILINGAAPSGAQAVAAANALKGAGLLSFTPAMPNGGSASLGWSYDPGNVNLDFLNPGDSLTVTYQVKANDGSALSTSTETVVITITGTAETQTGTPDDDTLTGNNNLADDLSGLEGDDILDGRSGNDTLDGGEGDDVLRGGAGDDRIEGGEGNDTIQGGSGNDTAVYAKAWAEYNVQRVGSSYFIEDRDTGDTDTLNSIEFIEFAGTSYAAAVAVDDAPVASNDNRAAGEDGTVQVVGNVLANDTDADVPTSPALGDALTVIGGRTGTEAAGGGFQLPGTVLTGTYGTLTINTDGSYTYDLANASAAVQSLKQGQTVTDSFAYRVADAKGLVDTAQLQITVTGTNDAPVVSGAVTLPAAPSNTGTVVITAAQLLANSSDVDGDALSVVNLMASSGTLVSNGGGVWSFTPVANGPASVNFTYSVSDGIATTAATATLAVGDVNDAPIANDVILTSATEDAGVSRVLTPTELASDVDSTLTTASFTFSNATVNGNLVSLAAAGISYDTGTGLFSVNTTGNALYQGLQVGETATVVANFTASDGSLSDAGTVTVQITGVNDAPVAVNDTGLVATEGQTAIINPALLAANDTDVDGDTLNVLSVSNAMNGTVSYVNGYILFTPATGYSGPASFDYTISDGTATSTATAFVNVTAVNDAPTAPATQTLDIDEDGTTGAVSIGATDLDFDTLVYSVEAGDEPAFGSVSLDQTAGTFTYTPNANANGTDTFTITVSDGNGGTTEQVVTVNVAPVNDAPTAPATQTLDIDEDGTTGAVNIGAADIDSSTLVYSIASGDEPAFGSVSFNQVAGTFTYTPDANANGTDTFTITVSDGNGGTTEQVVTVNVAPVNDDPAAPATQTLDIDEDGTTGAVNIGAADIDSSTLVYSIASGDEPAFGSVSLDQTAGTFTYTPDANANGTDTFTITVTDGDGGTTEQVVTVNVAPANDDPTAPATQTLDIDEDSTTGAVNIGAADIDSSTLTYSIASGDEPAFGSVSFDQTAGTFTYTPDANANGTDTFTITVSDGDGGTTEQVVTVNVGAVPDAPTDLSLNNASVVENAANGTVVGTATPVDVDSSSFTFALLDNAGGRFAIDNTGQITVADGSLLDFETATSHSIQIQVTDDSALSYTETFVITVNDVVEGNSYTGTAGNDTAASPNDAPWTADGLAGNDDLTGGAGSDIINGGEDNDVLEGRAGADQINGGNGNDTARYALSSAAVTVNLLTAVAMGGDAQGDVLTSIENLIGSAFADTLTGDNQSNVLTGGLGGDTLVGNGGIDTASYAASISGVTVNLSVLSGGFTLGTGGDAEGDRLQGIENLVGSAFVDRLTGATTGSDISGGDGADILRASGGTSVLRGGNGDDQLRSATASDTLIGGADNDTYFVTNTATQVVELLNEGTDTVSSSATFTLSANVENLTLTGNGAINGTGNGESNTIIGNDAVNTLRGGAGALDILRGMGGNDILIGGEGADRLNGGTGADTFLWETLSDLGADIPSADQVQDFNRAEGDKMDISLIDADTSQAGDQAFTFIGGAEFTGVAGQLRSYVTAANQLLVAGDTNGDGIADLFIRVSFTTDPTLLATDFIL